jgi:tetratricopeptide (TPR) repeat protein
VIAPHDPVVHHARAVLMAYMGRIEEALSSIGRAARLEPLVLSYQEIEGFYLYLARRPRRAARHLERLLEIEPRLYLARMGLGHARAALGEAQEAAAAYRCAMQATGAHPYPLASLGVLFASTSRPRDAAAVLAELAGWSSSRYVRPTYIAAIHAALGSHDAAFAALARAIDEHDIHVTSILADPIYDPVRGDRRFRPLVQRMGLHSVSVGVRE